MIGINVAPGVSLEFEDGYIVITKPKYKTAIYLSVANNKLPLCFEQVIKLPPEYPFTKVEIDENAIENCGKIEYFGSECKSFDVVISGVIDALSGKEERDWNYYYEKSYKATKKIVKYIKEVEHGKA